MSFDADLLALASQVGQFLLQSQRRLVSAESCTGGFIAKALTDIPGSSQWFECGYVTYSNAAKTRDLGVLPGTLLEHGAVSEAAVREMAAGALRVARVDVAIAVTGIAGPDGAAPGKPVGTVWFGTCVRRAARVEVATRREQFAGDRYAVRRSAVDYALKLILNLKLG
jgi:nicotinamide-nucleotide amidase